MRMLLLVVVVIPLAASADRPLEVTFTGDTLTIGSTVVRTPYKNEAFTKILGPPERTTVLANTIYTWDSIGVALYGKQDTPASSTFTVTFRRSNLKFFPKKPFRGVVRLSGITIDRPLTRAELKKAGFEKSFSDRTLTRSEQGYPIYVELGEDGRLVELHLTLEKWRP